MKTPENLLEELTENSRLLFIEPHPDDAIISCGSLFEYAPCKMQMITLSRGEAAYGTPSDKVAAFRLKETKHVREAYSLFFKEYDFADGDFSRDDSQRCTLQSMFCLMADALRELKPTHVFFPARTDQHKDHAYTGEKMAMVADYASDWVNPPKFFEYDSTTPLQTFTHYVPLQYDNLIPDLLIKFYPSQADSMQDFISGFSGLARYRGMQVAPFDKSVHYAQVFNRIF